MSILDKYKLKLKTNSKVNSPFRYPGSKGRLLDWILPHIPQSDKPFIDVFTGGGSVVLAVANRDLFRPIVLNDKDPFISDFWQCLLDSDSTGELCSTIEEYKPSVDKYLELQAFRLGEKSENTVKNAFAAIAINRMAFSGISMSGPIGGINQKSKYTVDCRWSSKNLIKNIKFASGLLKGRTTVTNLDFSDFENHLGDSAFIYFDPPYYAQGDVLYNVSMTEEEHKNLAKILQTRNNWLLSYDGCKEIYDLYNWANIVERDEHSMLARKKKKEVLISPKCQA